MSAELIEFAAEQQRSFDVSTSAEERKSRGHFGTPPAIADFMANLFSGFPHEPICILDPGAGVGTLSAAVCKRILSQTVARRCRFELWENDPALEASLDATMSHCQRAMREAGHEMEYVIRTDDFILANKQKSLFDERVNSSFHLTQIGEQIEQSGVIDQNLVHQAVGAALRLPRNEIDQLSEAAQ